MLQSFGLTKRQECDNWKKTSMVAEFNYDVSSSSASALGVFGGQIASGFAIASATTKFATDTAAFELGCDDVPFDEIKEILRSEFRTVNINVDRNYGAVRENLLQIYANYQALKQVESKVDETLRTMVRRFDRLDDRFNEVKDAIQELRDLVVDLKIQDFISDLIIFIEDFKVKKEGLKGVSHQRRMDLLEGEHGHLMYFRKAIDPQGSLSLHSLLNKILIGGYAVPENATDKKKLMALSLLYEGTNTYIDILHFLRDGYKYLAIDCFRKSNVECYNHYYTQIGKVDVKFRNALHGVGSQTGLLTKVMSALNQVRALDFIQNEKKGTYDILTEQVSYLEKVNAELGARNDIRNQERAYLQVSYDFANSTIETPFLGWKNGTRVRYAVHNGMDSPVSSWSEPHYTVEGKACPKLTLNVAPFAKDLVIFRRFDEKEPQLVGVVHNQTEFRDIDRDLFDAVSEGNERLAKINAYTLIQSGANVSTTYEGGKQAIHAATIAGHLQLIRTLIQNGADINAQDGRGYTPLHTASEVGNRKLVEALIQEGADVAVASHLNWTALHVAAKNGHVETIKVLLQAGSTDLIARTVGGFTPLHVAVSSRKKRAVKELASNERAHLNAQSDKLITPLQLAVLGLDSETIQTLLDNVKCDVNAVAQGGLTALHMAAIGGDATVFQQLLQHSRADVNIKSDDGWSPLHLALLLRKAAVTYQLLNATEVDINLQGKDNITPLHLACRTGQRAVALDLINRGVQLEARDNYSFTPLHDAADNGQLDTVTLLIGKNATLEAREKCGYTPLGLAVLNTHSDVVRKFIENNADVNSYNKKGVSLFEDAVLAGDVDIIHFLEESGAEYGQNILSVAALSHNWDLVKELIFKKQTLNGGRTPLHNACQLGNLDLVRFVYEKFKDVNAKDESGNTPLHEAVRSGNVELVEFLVEKMGDVNTQDQYSETPLHSAVQSGNLKLVEWLTKNGAIIDAVDTIDVTPLIRAIINNNLEIVKYLIEKGANVNAKIMLFQFTPLLVAIYKTPNLEMVTYLIHKGADVNVRDTSHRTALHLAIPFCPYEIVKFLIDNGSDKTARNVDGDTPLHIAARLRHTDVAQYLISKCNSCINIENLKGQTPLYYAVSYNTLEVLPFWSAKTEEDDAKDNSSETPLFEDSRNSNLDMVKCLTENGANVNATDNSGTTVLMAAIQSKNRDISRYLVAKGAKCQEGCQCVVSWFWGFYVRCDDRSRRRRSIQTRQVPSRSGQMQLKPRSGIVSIRDALAREQKNVTAISSWPVNVINHDNEGQNRPRIAGTDGRAGSAAFRGQLGYWPSLNDNLLLVKWLLLLFGRRSFVEGMNNAERLTGAERRHGDQWAETYLREGLERYGERQ